MIFFRTKDIFIREGLKRSSAAKKFISKNLPENRILYQWNINLAGPKESYPRQKFIYSATDAISGKSVFINPETGESRLVKRYIREPVNPEQVNQEVSKPKPPSPAIQHEISTQEISKPVEPAYKDKSQKTQRKVVKLQSRAVKDINFDKIQINSKTIKAIKQKAVRRSQISARNRYRWKIASDRRKAFYAELKRRNIANQKKTEYKTESHAKRAELYVKSLPKRVVDAITKAKEAKAKAEEALRNYIKNPSRKLDQDIKTFWEDVKATGKRFNKKTQFVNRAKTLWGNKWIRKGIYGIGATIAFNLVRDQLAQVFIPQRAIPEEYERGYDIMDEQLTDFGSPLKLAKAAHKVMVPYYSTVRSSLRTNVNTVINNNLALRLSRHENVIGHTRY